MIDKTEVSIMLTSKEKYFQPIYEQLTNRLRKNISGKILPGEKILPDRVLSEKYKVSLMTMKKALSKLVDEGLIVRYQGRGTFVTELAFPEEMRINFAIGNKLYKPAHEKIMQKLDDAFPHITFKTSSKKYIPGEMTDIARFNIINQENYYDQMIDLSPFIKKDKCILDKQLPQLNDLGIVNGKRVGIPLYCCPKFIVYNKKLFSKANIPFPEEGWKWKDFKRTLDLFDKVDDLGFYSFGSTPGINRWIDFIWQNEGSIFNGDKFILNSKKAKEAIRFFNDINTMKNSPPNFVANDLDTIFTLFAEEKLAITISNRIHIAIALKNNIDYGVVPLPYSKVPANHLAGCLIGIPKTCTDYKKGWEILKYMLSADVQDIISKEHHHYPANTDSLHNYNSEEDNMVLKELDNSHSKTGIYSKEIFNLINSSLQTYFLGVDELDKCLERLDIIIESYMQEEHDFDD